MPRLPFRKMQGLGNDFLVVDLLDSPAAEATEQALRGAAGALCDRHFGVGADGILLIRNSARAHARMLVLNADGSEAEMCGNGLRCVARHLWEHRPALRGAAAHLEIETGAGVLACTPVPAGAGLDFEIGMGAPRFLRGELPMAGPPAETFVCQPLQAGGRTFIATAVSMGNPHVVLFIDGDGGRGGDEPLRALAERYGPLVERDPLFPARTNVAFARLAGAAIDLVVWERGCGVTLACGTGACATVAAACKTGRWPAGRRIAVRLPGGVLQITATLGDVRMCGPAIEVFAGSVLVGE